MPSEEYSLQGVREKLMKLCEERSSYKCLSVVTAKSEPRLFNSCRSVWLYCSVAQSCPIL